MRFRQKVAAQLFLPFDDIGVGRGGANLQGGRELAGEPRLSIGSTAKRERERERYEAKE